MGERGGGVGDVRDVSLPARFHGAAIAVQDLMDVANELSHARCDIF